MRGRPLYSWLVLGGLNFVLSACGLTFFDEAQGPELPDRFGIYALHDAEDDYQRIHGDRVWEEKTWPQRSNLAPQVQFVVYDPSLAADARPLEEKVRLQKVAWVRSEIDGKGSIKPAAGSQWVVPTLETLVVPASLAPVEGRADAVHVVPVQPLEPGLYSLQLLSTQPPAYSRIGIGWPTADKVQYSAANCVDRYVGRATFYRSCNEQTQAIGELQAQDLRIHLVKPERITADGVPTLVVRGVVVNAASGPRTVPSLNARIQDQGGATLHEWRFSLDSQEIGPGQSVAFRTEVRRPPAATSQVNVNFGSTTAAELAK